MNKMKEKMETFCQELESMKSQTNIQELKKY